MQTSTQPSQHGPTAIDVPSVMRVEQLRTSAENNLRRESRLQNANLPRLLIHVAMLESIDDLQAEQAPPPYNVAVSRSTSTCSSTATPTTDELPTLEENKDLGEDSESDGSEKYEWSDDDEVECDEDHDAEHGLLRIPSHAPIFIKQEEHCTWACTSDDALDPFHWAELALELAPKAERNPDVMTSIVEVAEVED